MKNSMIQVPKFLLVFLMVFAFVSCESDSDEINFDQSLNADARKGAPMKGDMTIAAIALGNEDFEELVKAVVYVSGNTDTNVLALISGEDQYTVFAPTDLAFEALYAALGVSSIEEVDANLVRDVLLYHVTDGRRATNSVVPRNNVKTIETALGVNFYVTTDPMIKAVGNTAGFVATDVSASNGIVHIIDTVLLPVTPESLGL